MRLIFLGCGDSKGVPRAGCECDICRNVLSPGSRNYRTGPSIVLCYGPPYAQRTVLVDAAPEFRLQATGLNLRQVDALLITHAHDDHILGFSTLVNAQRLAERQLPIYAPDHVLEEVHKRFEYIWTNKIYRKVIQPQAIDGAVDLWGLGVRPLRVDHGYNGTAYGYLMTFGGRRLAYVSDMLRATTEVREALAGLDLLVLGASHYYEGIEMWRRSVIDVTGALELIGEVTPTQAILTHLSHTIDYDQVSAKLPPNVSLAYDGLTVEVLE
jgi:phosphoribosyl 1,2-cyclic phosphate phosphodiesterase